MNNVHAKLLAKYTLTKLFDLEEIDRSGISEESKRKRKNAIFNELRKSNINILNELSDKSGKRR